MRNEESRMFIVHRSFGVLTNSGDYQSRSCPRPPRDLAYCSIVKSGGEPVVVADALEAVDQPGPCMGTNWFGATIVKQLHWFASRMLQEALFTLSAPARKCLSRC